MKNMGIPALLWALALCLPTIAFAAGDIATKFSNKGSIGNTRHNMMQRQASGGGPNATKMEDYRNDYGEVCVYCHTPHGANSEAAVQNAPLWNRTYKATAYSTYDQAGTATLTPDSVSQPGTNSLTCLSCHDGQVAIDSVINMPGSGRYSKNQETSSDEDGFLTTEWPLLPSGPGYKPAHQSLVECMSCHSTAAGNNPGATNFAVFVIGTDLRNDHPVGVTFPTTNSADFNQPTDSSGTTIYFDNDGNHKMGAAEVRAYDGKVECASCHDPHGVPIGGTPGIQGTRSASADLITSFLRVPNTGSALCMTCHVK
jgi:mono/diheme cytochrome c family protein